MRLKVAFCQRKHVLLEQVDFLFGGTAIADDELMANKINANRPGRSIAHQQQRGNGLYHLLSWRGTGTVGHTRWCALWSDAFLDP